MNRAVTLAAQSPVYSYFLSTRIVAPDLKSAIAHARACHDMWNDAFVVVSDEETDEPATDAGEWPRTPRFDMQAHANQSGKIRVVAAVRQSA